MPTTLHYPEQQQRQWVVIDAKGQVLGRLASRIATMLRGKHKAAYTPYIDTGDFVVVINAQEVQVTGSKRLQRSTIGTPAIPAGAASAPSSRC